MSMKASVACAAASGRFTSVRNMPGAIELTVRFSAPNSAASERVRASRPPFAAEYDGSPGIDSRATLEVTKISRSEERRVGTECGSTCRSRWSQYHKQQNKQYEIE